MKRLLLLVAMLMVTLTGFAQGVKIQAFTTNSGPFVTNIVVSLSSNLQPNRLKATNTILGPSAFVATSGTNGYWQALTNIATPVAVIPGASSTVTTNASASGTTFAVNVTGVGAATNLYYLSQGSNMIVTTNGFDIRVNALTDTNVVQILATQLTNFFRLQDILNPPHVGPATNAGDYSITGNNTPGVMLRGTGIVHSLWIQCDVGSSFAMNTNMANVRLEVFVDGGNTTNLSFRTIDVSLADLFGNRFRFLTNGHWAVIRDSVGLFTHDESTNRLYAEYIKTMDFRLPIYFTNNCLIRLTNSLTGQLWTHGYINPTYEQGPLEKMAGYKSYRLRSKTTYGQQVATVSNFLFSATGPGLCVGFLQSFLDSAGNEFSAFVDSKGPTFLTAPGTTWQTGGGDDFYLSTYGMSGGFNVGPYVGVINRWYGPNNDSVRCAVEGYRWFQTDGIYWTNGVTVYIPNSSDLSAMSATMFYYAP